MSGFLTKHEIEHGVMQYVFLSIGSFIVGSFFLYLTLASHPAYVFLVLFFYFSTALFIYGITAFATLETAARKLPLYKISIVSECNESMIFKMATDDIPGSGMAYIQSWHSHKDKECYLGVVQHLEFNDDDTYVAKLIKW